MHCKLGSAVVVSPIPQMVVCHAEQLLKLTEAFGCLRFPVFAFSEYCNMVYGRPEVQITAAISNVVESTSSGGVLNVA